VSWQICHFFWKNRLPGLEQGKYAAAAGRTALWQICQNKNMANKPRTLGNAGSAERQKGRFWYLIQKLPFAAAIFPDYLLCSRIQEACSYHSQMFHNCCSYT